MQITPTDQGLTIEAPMVIATVNGKQVGQPMTKDYAVQLISRFGYNTTMLELTGNDDVTLRTGTVISFRAQQ